MRFCGDEVFVLQLQNGQTLNALRLLKRTKPKRLDMYKNVKVGWEQTTLKRDGPERTFHL